MDRHFLLLFITVIGFLGHPFSQMDAQETDIDIQDINTNNITVQPAQGILWEITGRNLENPSYIYAVLHLIPMEYFFLHPGLDSAIKKVDLVMMEIDPEQEKKDYLFRSEVPIDSTLDIILSKREFKSLENFIDDKLTVDSRTKLLQRYPPLIVLRQMMIDYCLYRRINQEVLSYEYYIHNATQDKAFESLQMEWIRLAWLDSHSLQEQSKMLLKALEEKEKQKLAYEGMLRAYRQENLDRVWLLSMDAPDLGDNKHTLFDLKVSNWKKAMMQKMPHTSVGAIVPAHLLSGEYGLLHLLRKSGYTVRPISMK